MGNGRGGGLSHQRFITGCYWYFVKCHIRGLLVTTVSWFKSIRGSQEGRTILQLPKFPLLLFVNSLFFLQIIYFNVTSWILSTPRWRRGGGGVPALTLILISFVLMLVRLILHRKLNAKSPDGWFQTESQDSCFDLAEFHQHGVAATNRTTGTQTNCLLNTSGNDYWETDTAGNHVTLFQNEFSCKA